MGRRSDFNVSPNQLGAAPGGFDNPLQVGSVASSNGEAVTKPATRIAIVESHAFVSVAIEDVISRSFSNSIELAATWRTTEEVLLGVAITSFDVMIIGTSQSIENCLELLSICKQSARKPGFVALQIGLRHDTATLLARRGIHAIVDEFGSHNDVHQAILAAAATNSFCNQHVAHLLMRSVTSASADLTTRELDVLDLLMAGGSNKEIARRLEITPKTVEMHLGHIYDKFDVSSRSGAILRALECGLPGAARVMVGGRTDLTTRFLKTG